MDISVHYLFSKNKKIGSKIIRAGTSYLEPSICFEKTPSHVAILIQERWVIESTMESGVRVIPYQDWLKINIEINKIKCTKQWTMEQIKSIYKPLKGLKYDYMGIIYFSYRIFLNRVFSMPIPQQNYYNHDDMFFCSEMVSKMTGVSYEMVAPVQLMVKIENKLGEFLDN